MRPPWQPLIAGGMVFLLVIACSRSGFEDEDSANQQRQIPFIDAGPLGGSPTDPEFPPKTLDGSVGGDVGSETVEALSGEDRPDLGVPDSSVRNTEAVHQLGPVQHLWSLASGELGWDEGHAVAADDAGNIVVVGAFEWAVDFGDQTLESVGMADIFVVSYDGGGAVRWARRFGGSENDVARGVAVASNGDVYVVGQFRQTADFGAGALVSAGEGDVFLLSLDAAGKTRWAARYGGSKEDEARAIALDASGRPHIAGTFNGEVDFGGVALTPSEGSDLFVASYPTSGGSARVAGRFGGGWDDAANGIALDDAGNIYLTGQFRKDIDFGGRHFTSRGLHDIFIASLSPTLAHRWSVATGNTSWDRGNGIAVLPSADLVCSVGVLHGVGDFGGGSLTPGGGHDAFLACYDLAGQHRWSRIYGNSLTDEGHGIAISPAGLIAITGAFKASALDFGGGPLSSPWDHNVSDVAIATFDAEGRHRWSALFGGVPGDSGNALAFDRQGGLVATGRFGDTADFGGETFKTAGMMDSFVARMAE